MVTRGIEKSPFLLFQPPDCECRLAMAAGTAIVLMVAEAGKRNRVRKDTQQGVKRGFRSDMVSLPAVE